MGLHLDNFLHSFARDLVVRAAAAAPPVTIPYAADASGGNLGLWRGRAVEDSATDPYTVLRITGGPPSQYDALPRLSLQVFTTGKVRGAIEPVLNRAQSVYETCLDAEGLPARMRVIDGYTAAENAANGHWRIVSIDPLQRPGSIGPDVNGREQVSFNLDLGFFKKD
jgi:hypothetical protein